MPTDKALAERMREARFATQLRLRERVSQERMGQLVGEAAGENVSQSEWSRYEAGTEPPLAIIRAIAKVSGLSEPYIAFGITLPTSIPSEVVQVHKLTEQQGERARRVAQAERLAKQQQQKRRRGPGKAG